MAQAASDRLIEDLRQVIRDAEELLRVTAGQAGEKIAEARARAEESLLAARSRLAELGSGAAVRAQAAADSADLYVRANPWAAIGIVAATGLLVGLLIGRRGGDR